MSSGDEKSPPDNKGESAKQEDESEGGLLPAILVGAGLLAVVALLLFGGGDDEEAEKGKAGQDKTAAAQGAGGRGGAAGGGAQGGVAARPTDDPSRKQAAGPGEARLNPAVRPFPGKGINPVVPKEEPPPADATTEELITWYEKKLEVAQRMLESRQTFKDRLPQIQERIENSDSPERDKQLEAFEGRKKLVEKNFETAKKKVEDIEAKLAELRGEG